MNKYQEEISKHVAMLNRISEDVLGELPESEIKENEAMAKIFVDNHLEYLQISESETK